MICGLWANPNYDDNKQTRRRAIDDINANHQEVVRELYAKIEAGQKHITEVHPFYTVANEAPIDPDPDRTTIIQELDQM